MSDYTGNTAAVYRERLRIIAEYAEHAIVSIRVSEDREAVHLLRDIIAVTERPDEPDPVKEYAQAVLTGRPLTEEEIAAYELSLEKREAYRQ